MSNATKEVTINGTSYTIGLHGPDEGDEIIAYIAKVSGPVMMAFAGGMDRDMISPEVGKALSGALANVNGKEHAKFMRLLLSTCIAGGLPLDGPGYDAHFIGRLGERYKLAAEVIKHNGFFGVAGALTGDLWGTGSPLTALQG